jgi:hypothetical protein
MVMAIFAAIVGPKDGWLLLWIVVYGGLGAVSGILVGTFAHILICPPPRDPE